MEAFEELGEGLLWSLFDLRQVDVRSPLLAASNELTDELVGQVLEAGYTPQGKTVKPRLRHSL